MLIMRVCPFVDTARLLISPAETPTATVWTGGGGCHISLVLMTESLHQLGESVQWK